MPHPYYFILLFLKEIERNKRKRKREKWKEKVMEKEVNSFTHHEILASQSVDKWLVESYKYKIVRKRSTNETAHTESSNQTKHSPCLISKLKKFNEILRRKKKRKREKEKNIRSYRPGRNLEISSHWLPSFSCKENKISSSSWVQGFYIY